MDLVVTSYVLSHRTARMVLDRCVKQAAQMDLNVAVAVVDPAGHLVCFERMDGTALLCSTLAQDKAHTVAVFGLPTHECTRFVGTHKGVEQCTHATSAAKGWPSQLSGWAV
jgi:uncharacterized protein GlcG (DUF336 family)